MNAAPVALLSIALFFFAYRLYGRWIARRLFEVSADRPVPSRENEDGIDFVPTNRYVLFGHHFASIAGAGPIVGPALAVIYGWLPALLWILVGTIFVGAVHDIGSLLISIRHSGHTISDVTETLMGRRARAILVVVTFFLLLLVVAVFALVIAGLFKSYPEAVFPSAALVVIAISIGLLVYRVGVPLVPATVIGVALMALSIWYGIGHPMGQNIGPMTWVVVLLAYAFVASVLPVWLLLQPRDYLNSFGLYFGIGLTYLALFVAHPRIVAPAVRATGAGAPPMIPFLFIIVACGAISGFHSLISSGTTARQLGSERDAAFVGYGSMLVEGAVAVMAVLACTAGLGSASSWAERYQSWGAFGSLDAKLGAFIEGGDHLLQALRFAPGIGGTLLTVIVVGFVLTSLDTASRLMRFTITELGESFGVKLLQNRYLASLIAVGSAFILATIKVGGKETGMMLWPAFGTTNQVFASLVMIVISVYLLKFRKPVWPTVVPAAFMLAITAAALVNQLGTWIREANWPLVGVGLIILGAELWIAAEGTYTLLTIKKSTDTGLQLGLSDESVT